MKLTITLLSENAAAGAGILGEWGLSILVESDELAVLLDAGQGISAAHNAPKLGVDLARIDRIVLSHAHYDHTGGLAPLLRRVNREIEVIAHPGIWVPRQRRRQGEQPQSIGMSYTRRRLEKLGARFNLTSARVRLSENIWTTGEIPRSNEYEGLEPDLWTKGDGGWLPDDFPDDQALIVKTRYGLVVVLGCAHRGMVNTLEYARKLTGTDRVHAVIGGSHLHHASEERVMLSLDALRGMKVERLGLCHCTGEAVSALFAGEFGSGFTYCHAGTRLDLSGG